MFEKLLEKICNKLNKSKIPYMIIGGQAVLFYGEPRATKDIDVTLGINIDKIDRIKSVIKELGFNYLVNDIEAFAGKTMVVPVVDKKSGIRIDFILSFSLYEKQAMARTKMVKIGRTIIKYASLEDTIIHKIIAGRPRDIEDARAIILKNRKFDRKYIEKWLSEFEISLSRSFLHSFRKLLN